MPYEYEAPYNYPYGKYVMVKKFSKLNGQILEKVKLLVSYQEIIAEDGEDHLLFKKNSPFDNIVRPIQTEIQKEYGDIFEGYGWLKNSDEADDCRKYIRLQYYLTAVALKLFNNLSSIEAHFEAAFLKKSLFLTAPFSRPWHFRVRYPTLKEQKAKFIEILEPVNIYPAVKYLEQLGFSKNPVKNKELVSKIRQRMKELEKDMAKRNLTKEEWEAREKTKMRVKY
jgi:hypothetical protein